MSLAISAGTPMIGPKSGRTGAARHDPPFSTRPDLAGIGELLVWPTARERASPCAADCSSHSSSPCASPGSATWIFSWSISAGLPAVASDRGPPVVATVCDAMSIEWPKFARGNASDSS